MDPLRIGLVGVAHLHVHAYVHQFLEHPLSTIVGVWDHKPERATHFAKTYDLKCFSDSAELLSQCDAVVICSENMLHLAHIRMTLAFGLAILCEKPVVASMTDCEELVSLESALSEKFMTAFPCRFSPAYAQLKARCAAGEIGAIQAIMATNRGTCPGDWFTQPELSGGGAMIDHVVHLADLLRDLLQQEPTSVHAQIGNNMYGQTWDDTAMVSLGYGEDVFATLDSSWSRTAAFKTWGDVTMRVVGTQGAIDMDMFQQGMDMYKASSGKSHSVVGFGSDLDGLMVDAFVKATLAKAPYPVTLQDGIAASRVSLRAYKAASPIAFSPR